MRITRIIIGLPWWVSSKEDACNAGDGRRFGFNPWVRKTKKVPLLIRKYRRRINNPRIKAFLTLMPKMKFFKKRMILINWLF